MASLGIDMITKKLRTARDPYTTLTDKQINNIPRDPGAFFMISRPEKSYPEKGWYRDRYATNTNQHLFRGHNQKEPLCWIDAQWQRDPPQLHNTCRHGASERWGPDKVGNRTMQHFNKPEDPNRFLTTELYRRQPTNLPGQLNMSYGRPAEGYYALRNPNSTTWFGSSVPLNRTQILQDINPKTSAEYEQIKRFNESRVLDKKDNFPFYSEYTDRFAAHTKTVPILTTLQRRKMYLQES
ncbi:uncharacterized protein LOC125679934 isoform X2 [Ostrea edulis]|uniref:uncharacterized protein LOC125679934 isoform X2 n=1 Tax=Ostrea edulis TaxID=37623 RepID=UPI0024AF737E|nr:uncharacterized protein LOC125679934 isoform X2 [Ostrea edulis]XP_056017834.1 uncharacterized protein LOC125679934 isoform X2 [Ostrea edulis]